MMEMSLRVPSPLNTGGGPPISLHSDASRKTAPLVVPAGAIDIDSTFLNLDQVVDKMAALIGSKLN